MIATLPIQEKVQKFIHVWVTNLIDLVAKGHGGDPSSAISQENAVQVFQNLLHGGTLPVFLSRELQANGISLPQPFTYIDEVVAMTYNPYLERAAKRTRMVYQP